MRRLMLCALLPGAALAEPGGIYGFSGQTSSTCNNCHSGGTAPTVTFSGPAMLMGGASATYTLTVSGGAGVVAGLDVSVVGNATLIAGAGLQVNDTELTHTAPKNFSGGTASFSFTVTAPSATGTVKLFGAGLSANGNGHNSGDKAGTATLTIAVMGAPPPPVDAGSPPPPPPPPPVDAGSPTPPPPVDAGSPTETSDAGATMEPPVQQPAPMSPEPQALGDEMIVGGCSASGALPQALLLVLVAAFVVARQRKRAVRRSRIDELPR